MKGFDNNPSIAKSIGFAVKVPTIIPESDCEHCNHGKGSQAEDNFDEHGYPLPKDFVQAGHLCRSTETALDPTESSTSSDCFRFLDLPPEIRNRTYELAMCRPRQPVCVPDHLLRPSEDLADTKNVLRACGDDIICLPCQLHSILRTGNVGLSRACKQLHEETALVPYLVNTFNIHNLYYLQTFLEIIGERGRQNLRSLKFAWRLPEEEAHALGTYTSTEHTYTLLGECVSLVELSVDLDLVNMLSWRENGNPRSSMLNYVFEIPHIALMYELRGLKNIRVGWKHSEGLQEVENWEKTLAGYWRLPHGVGGESAVEVDAELEVTPDDVWHSIHWQATNEKRAENA